MIEVKAKSNFATSRVEYLYNAMIEQKYSDVCFTVRSRRYLLNLKNKKNLYPLNNMFSYLA